jgi:type VI secretion system secreted protein Hcp
MATYIYAKVTADADIEGGSTDAGFDKQMIVYEFDFNSYYNYNNVEGKVTSDQHGDPVKCKFKLDESAPELLKCFRQSKPLTVLFSWCDKDKGGKKATFFTVKLSNAKIVQWHVMTPNTVSRDTQEQPHQLEVAFSYVQVDVTHESFEDSLKKHPKKVDTFKFTDPTA